MSNQPDIRRSLVKPAIVFIGLVLVLAVGSIAINHWSWSHGRPKWAENIGVWNPYANLVLIAAWFAYAQMRRTRATPK
jgi:hypothetical protein